MLQNELDNRVIELHQRSADGVVVFTMNFAYEQPVDNLRQPFRPELEIVHAGEQQPHSRVKRDGQHSCDRHREILGVRERLKQAAFLSLERENWQECDSDDE